MGKTVHEVSALLDAGSTIPKLMEDGVSSAQIVQAVTYGAEMRNKAAQAKLPSPASQPDEHWAERKAWLLDGQSIHGDLKEFYFPALEALKADDQVTYSQQRDLLMKAMRTFLGDTPPAPVDPVDSVAVAIEPEVVAPVVVAPVVKPPVVVDPVVQPPQITPVDPFVLTGQLPKGQGKK